MRWELFSDLPSGELQRVLTVARRRTFARGEVVFHERDPADSLHLIEKGRFAVRVTTPLGETAMLAIRGPGEAFDVGAERRVLRRLRDLATVYGDGSETVTIPLTQEDLAGLAGTSRATVNRALREEESRGTVKLGRGKTIVLDLAELTRRAH